MMKYPNGTIKKVETKVVKTPNEKKSKLGADFEHRINDSNEYYLAKGIAAIYKKPTPVQVVQVDYPARNKARIKEAYYKTPSTTDYNGIYREKYIDFEAKSTQENFFSFSRIYEHQVKHLELVHKLGGISFLIIEFSKKKEVYILPTPYLLKPYYAQADGERKSMPYSYVKEYGTLIDQSYKPEIDYLKAVDKIYFENENAKE